jgi:hypothetical protein
MTHRFLISMTSMTSMTHRIHRNPFSMSHRKAFQGRVPRPSFSCDQKPATQQQRQKEYERAISCREVVAKSSKENQSTNIPYSTPIETVEKEPPSFFPTSKPSIGHNLLSPHDSSKNGGTQTPVEVTSPFQRGNPNAQPAALEISYGEDNTEVDEDLFDFDDDGVSAITQATVDEMMKQLEQQPTDFPNDFLLNRVYSDVTDPIPPSFLHMTSQNNETSHIIMTTQSRTMLPPPTSNTDNLNMFPPEGRSMSPPRLTRQNRSSDTRSFYTKTTDSMDTDDFSAWKQDLLLSRPAVEIQMYYHSRS